MRKISLLIASGAVAVALLATAAPSQAHDSRWLTHAGGGKGVVFSSHKRITVCDTAVDGHQVWVGFNVYIAPQGGGTNPRYWTTDRPPSQGCIPHGVYFLPISQYRVCISYEGCTPFKKHSSSSWRPFQSTSIWRTW